MLAVAVFAVDLSYRRTKGSPLEKHIAPSIFKNDPASEGKSNAVGAHALLAMEPAGLKRGNGHFSHLAVAVCPK
jgi:hypothetical protein